MVTKAATRETRDVLDGGKNLKIAGGIDILAFALNSKYCEMTWRRGLWIFMRKIIQWIRK